MGRIVCFLLCWESFVPVVALHAVCWESFVPGSVRCVAGGWWFAGKGSPCSGCLCLDRDNFLPARLEWAEIGVFCCAGRVLYRFGLEAGVAGRVLYRFGLEAGVAGRVLYRFGLEVGVAGRVLYRGVCAAWLVSGGLREKILPARVVCVWTVTVFSLLALDGLKWAVFPVLGEFCTGCGLTRRVLGEFCTGCGLTRRVLGEFCTGLALRWGCRESFVPGSVRCVAGGRWFAGKSSPCSGCLLPGRDNFLPARVKWAELCVFCCVGRVLYRFGLEVGVAGRVLYRWAPVRGFTGQQWKISTPVTRRSVRARSARVRWPPEGPR